MMEHIVLHYLNEKLDSVLFHRQHGFCKRYRVYMDTSLTGYSIFFPTDRSPLYLEGQAFKSAE